MNRILLPLFAIAAFTVAGCDTGTEGGTNATTTKPAENFSGNVSIGKPAEAPPEVTQGQKAEGTAAPGATLPKDGEEVAVMETSQGQIILKFFPKQAPKHVESFKNLSKKGFYDGTKFHRAVPGFMIQGGDPNTKTGEGQPGTGGPGYNLKAEFNEIKHTRGILSMARSQSPDSAGSQFFVMHGDAPFLDNQYTVFGQVVSGMDAVDKIVSLPTSGESIQDMNQAVIKSVKIVKWPVKK